MTKFKMENDQVSHHSFHHGENVTSDRACCFARVFFELRACFIPIMTKLNLVTTRKLAVPAR